MKKLTKSFLVGALCAALIAVGVYSWQSRQDIAFADCLDETIFTANGQKVQMKDLGFYVLYEEREVELQAQVYNPENTRDYWNLHVNGVFIEEEAKDTILEMAIHDQLFYQKAMEENLTLDADEENSYRNAVSDFWMDLLEGQAERMPVSKEDINETMHQIALAEKYQAELAEEMGDSYASYNWDGYGYQQWRETQDVEVNEKLWDRISVGNISLEHGAPNYINGLSTEESE